MKKMMKIVAGMVLSVAPIVYGLNSYVDDFSGPTHGFQYVHDGTLDGMGHLILDDGDFLYRHVGTGDFAMEMVFNNIDMGGGLGGDNYRQWYYQITDQDGSYFLPRFQNGGDMVERSYFVLEYNNPVTGIVAPYVEYIGSLTSFVLRLEWSDALGSYKVSRSVNGGPMELVHTATGFGPSKTTRHEYLYDQDAGNPVGDVYPVMSLDFYSMIIPEPTTLAILGLGSLVVLPRKG